MAVKKKKIARFIKKTYCQNLDLSPLNFTVFLQYSNLSDAVKSTVKVRDTISCVLNVVDRTFAEKKKEKKNPTVNF